jgi:hypothetical protein
MRLNLKKISFSLTMVATQVYLIFFVVNFFLYNYGYRMEFLPQDTRDLFVSLGRFNINSHPQYRPWLKAFVRPQGTIAITNRVGDCDRCFFIDRPISQTFRWSLDEEGFPNKRPMSEANVLFVGDSFCFGASGFEENIPQMFEKKTGALTYNMSNSGYGLTHYYDLIQYAIGAHPQAPMTENRFQGKIIYVLLYLGNDFTEDMTIYLKRRRNEEHGFIFHYATLRAVLHLTKLEMLGLKQRFQEKVLSTPMKNRKAPSESEYDAHPNEFAYTNGYFPVFLQAESYKNSPICFHPYIKEYFLRRDWLPQRKTVIRSAFLSMKNMAESQGLDIRFVLLPQKLTVFAPYFPKAAPHSTNLFYEDFKTSAPVIEELYQFVLSTIKETGFNQHKN